MSDALIRKQRQQTITRLKEERELLLGQIRSIDNAIEALENVMTGSFTEQNSDGYYKGNRFIKIERDDDDPWAG
jgi:hypothetical protein